MRFRDKFNKKLTALTNVFTEKVASVVIFVWLVAQHPTRGELKCANMMNGVQSVIMDGEPLMLKWSADNWDLKHEVCYCGEIYLQ